MHVSPSQLIPGCIITEDVYGKTHQPIVTRNTTVTEQHITLLNKFLVDKVVVSSTLAQGQLFTPEETGERTSSAANSQTAIVEAADFLTLYRKTVALYKELFTRWQGNTAIDISVVRRVIFPVIDRLEEAGDQIFFLHQYATKEDYFYHHSVSTALLSAYIAKKNHFSDYRQVGLAGFLADCGMAKVDYTIVEKEGPLTSREYEEIKKHPTYSYRLVENISSLPLKVKLGVLQHHEKPDGSGYPLGVGKEKIHSFAACISIADMYHAMTSERYYQPGQSPYRVMDEMMHAHIEKYDREMLQAFFHSLAHLSPGTRVSLSNGQEAEIIFIDEKSPIRPVVRLADTQEIISLDNQRKLSIQALVL